MMTTTMRMMMTTTKMRRSRKRPTCHNFHELSIYLSYFTLCSQLFASCYNCEINETNRIS